MRDKPGDLKLLGGELVQRARVAPTRRLAARAQLHPPPLRSRSCPEALEFVESGSQVLARVDSTARAAEQLAERELGTTTLEGAGGGRVRSERRLEQAFGFTLLFAEQGVAVQHDRARPRSSAMVGPGFEAGEPVTSRFPLAGADRGVDSVECGPEPDAGRRDLSSVPVRVFRPAEPKLERCQRPVGGLDGRQEPSSGGKLKTLGRQGPALMLLSAVAG